MSKGNIFKKLALLFVVLTIFLGTSTALCAQEVYAGSHTVRVGLNFSATALNNTTIDTNTSGFYVSVPEYGIDSYFVEANRLFINSSGSSLTVNTLLGAEVASAEKNVKVSVSPASETGICTINGKNYRGSFEFYLNSDGKIVVINVIEIDTYLKGVLPSEIYPSWNMEALKAAAVVSRTFALRNATSSSHSSLGFDICSTTHCQVYSGTNKENDRTNQAIEETKGLVVKYNGLLAMTPYHSSTGGFTESASSTWGGSPETYPYLTNVFNPYENYRNVSNGKWHTVIRSESLPSYISLSYKNKLAGTNYTFDYDKLGNGYIGQMTVYDEYGNSLFLKTSANVRTFFGSLVKSANFGIANAYIPSNNSSSTVSIISSSGVQNIQTYNGYSYITSSGTYNAYGIEQVYVFDGKGFGHGVGMSQYGSKGLADAGFTYEEIIYLYFPGTNIVPFIE